MAMPMVWSLSEATNSSTSLGTWWTLCSSLPLLLDRPLGRQGLGGEAHVHDAGRVAVGGGQVDQPALAQDVEPAAVLEDVLVDELADALVDRRGELGQVVEGQLDVEVAASCRSSRRPSSRRSARRG